MWNGVDAWRAEAADVELTGDGVRATGTQLGIEPVPYRVEYRLDATEAFVTRTLEVEATGEGWARRISLAHDGTGGWSCRAEHRGPADLAPAGGDVWAVAGALDCDLEHSPLTNLMPVRRRALHRQPGTVDLLVAWVSVPALGLELSRQRYEHVRRDRHGSVVRFTDTDSGVTAELELDPDAMVIVYPGLAARVGAAPTPG
jgi:hypothetical protein